MSLQDPGPGPGWSARPADVQADGPSGHPLTLAPGSICAREQGCRRYNGHAGPQGGRDAQAHLGPPSSITEEGTLLGTVSVVAFPSKGAAGLVQLRSRVLAGMFPQEAEQCDLLGGGLRTPGSRGDAQHPPPTATPRL